MKLKAILSIVSILLFVFEMNTTRSTSNNATNTTMRSHIFGQLCSNYMNTYFKSDHSWECSIKKSGRNKTNLGYVKYSTECLCTTMYDCLDREEFELEPELINVSEYLKEKYALHKNFYSNECKSGLGSLTNETNWQCQPRYDRIQLEIYYCDCKRKMKCKWDQFIKI